MKPTRSLLFVPGHREGWAAKAVAAGADAVILDLEDSVPADMKAETRHIVAGTIGELAKNHPDVGVYVRLNALETGMTGDDLELVAVPGCHGFLPPKTYGARDIIQIEALVDHYERRNGVEAGSLEFVLPLETAQAYADCENMIKASPRCATGLPPPTRFSTSSTSSASCAPTAPTPSNCSAMRGRPATSARPSARP